MACKNDLEVDKILIWNTGLPYRNEPRTSHVFSLVGWEWCLRFVYCSGNDYHVITFHKMEGGKISAKQSLGWRNNFHVKVYMMHLTERECVVTDVVNKRVDTSSTILYSSGKKGEDIFQKLNWLYGCPEVKFASTFYGDLLSKHSLRIETDHLSPAVIEKSPPITEDKSVQVSPEVPRDIGVQVSQEVPHDIESLSSDLSHLLQEGILPDVRLDCAGRTFQAHRSVLAARSGVFRAMFENETLERETGAVKIQDVDVAVLEKLIKYLYTGRPDDLTEECIAHLYEAADKYGVHSLKTACTYWIERNLNEENCVKYLVVADSHSDGHLKDDLISFILQNPGVLKSEAWITFSKEPSKLINEVFQAYVASFI